MSVLSVDLGTSGVRAAAFSMRGALIATSAKRLSLQHHGVFVELDVNEIFTAAAECFRTVTAECLRLGDSPSAVSFSVQGEAICPINHSAELLALAPVSMDARGVSYATNLGSYLGAQQFQTLTGQPLHPMFSIFKIMANTGGSWLSDTNRFGTLDAVLAERLGGQFATDRSMAARTGAFDVNQNVWSAEVLSAIECTSGVQIHPEQLPSVVVAGTCIGHVTAAGEAEFGIPKGTAIVAGCHDQAAGWIGSGGTPGGAAVMSFGSSDCLTFGTAERPAGFDGTGLASYPLREGEWVTLAGTAAGGWALEWYANLVGATVETIFAKLPEVPSPVLVIPYLAGSGTLDNLPEATGLFAGLKLDTTRAEIARAIVEAAGFELWKIMQAVRSQSIAITTITAVGGGSHNEQALQIRSDAAGVAMRRGPEHASLLGAARLAAAGLGVELPSTPQHGIGRELNDQDWYAARRAAYVALFQNTKNVRI